MKINNVFKIIVLFFVLITFTNCNSIIDCIAGLRPELIAKDLNPAAIHQNYNENITFEMQHGNTTDYFISDVVIKGNLPPHISYNESGNTINFSGVPDTRGTYEFSVEITIEPYTYNEDGSNNLCTDTASKNYKITVL